MEEPLEYVEVLPLKLLILYVIKEEKENGVARTATECLKKEFNSCCI